MTMGALVRQTVLSVVTFIVATKTLGVWGGWRFQKKAREDLSGGGNNPMSGVSSLGVGAMKESIFLRESRFRDKSRGRRNRSGRDSRCKRG